MNKTTLDRTTLDTIKAYVTVGLFLLFTSTAYLIWPFCKDAMEAENTEKRELAEKPVFRVEAFDAFPAQYEEYLNDTLPFRSKLVEWNSALYYYGLHASVHESVVPGKDGWLFYAAEDSAAFYNGRKRYTTEELQRMADNMQCIKNCMERQGIRFALYIAPNKERVYPEYLPDYYGPPAEENALEQVISFLRENTDVTVVCPLDRLMAEKQLHPDRLLYRKTDTHWNSYGGYLGACELLKALNIPWDETKTRILQEPDEAGDLADMLNLAGSLDPGGTVSVAEYPVEAGELVLYEPSGHIRYRAPSQKTGRLLMARDSFCKRMAPALGSVFTESDMVHHAVFSAEMIKEQKPDIFVYEIVERSLDLLMDASY